MICSKNKIFAVAEFLSNNSVAVVPTRWISENEEDGVLFCAWPQMSSLALSRAIQKETDVDSSWEKHAIRIMYLTGKLLIISNRFRFPY